MRSDFIDKAKAIILENISNEQFGVSELAEVMNMSRSNLLRKTKKDIQLSASQFIRQVRLAKGMEMLKQNTLTVSEISYQVGFGSNSYFIKCFREFYGYPPGEVGRRGAVDKSPDVSTARQRQLAAIMFTDIEGYTSLMQKDESKAIAFRDRHREVFDFTTRKFNGRILQYYGDGTLSTFPSAINAVQCGIEMQLAFRKEEPRVPIRIGIHLGDIIVTDQEIIGDGVNVASRIESLAKTGSVYISEKVYDEIKNQPELLTASMGVHTLKNVTKPVEVYAVFNSELGGIDTPDTRVAGDSGGSSFIKWSIIAVAAILLAIFTYSSGFFNREPGPDSIAGVADKSIAVLPFKNESSDSSNLYFVNGLMESTLSKLQKIKDLRVISRSSVERYRKTDKTIPEMAEELKVNYFVTGSGQKIGDQVLLNIQLIEVSSDRQIWAEQYSRKVVDIFELQNEVAKKITKAIEVFVTPAELEQLEKKPTENLLAYDYYLQALGPFLSRTDEGLKKAIGLFEKAIEQDPEFALAYADIAISYYLLEMSQIEKQYTERINSYADKALLYDSKSDAGLIAKAFYYIQTEEYQLALPYLEKALEYNPNSNLAVQMLADFYFRMVPNSNKYLEYALKGIQLNVASDSVTQSYIYLGLGNALIENGFVDEALTYINKSLNHYSENHFAPYLKTLILFARDSDIEHTTKLLEREWQKDTTRLDILQDVANFHYFQEDYDSAFFYFEKFIKAKEKNGLDIYPHEDLKIGMVYQKMGLSKQAATFFSAYDAYCEKDQSIYKSMSLAMKYINEGENDQAIEQLKVFATQNNYKYWILIFIKIDPLMKPLKSHPEFEGVIQKIEDRFWENQTKLKRSLEEKGLI
ncbi:helix-turn-helix domain-containing protein [bacterium]|nr:helix-turn-helix domain-containing protein [bacterium]